MATIHHPNSTHNINKKNNPLPTISSLHALHCSLTDCMTVFTADTLVPVSLIQNGSSPLNN